MAIADGRPEGEKNPIVSSAMVPRWGPSGPDARVQPTLPFIKQSEPFAHRTFAFVREVVSGSRKRVQRRDVRPHARGQQSRRNRKILIVGRREPFALGIRGAKLGESGSGRGSRSRQEWYFIRPAVGHA